MCGRKESDYPKKRKYWQGLQEEVLTYPHRKEAISKGTEHYPARFLPTGTIRLSPDKSGQVSLLGGNSNETYVFSTPINRGKRKRVAQQGTLLGSRIVIKLFSGKNNRAG
jgi:hypothetical protein